MKDLQPVTNFGPESEDPRLDWRFMLPPSIDSERILVDMKRLGTLHRLAGIESSVVFDYQGERSEFTPGISGINADGSAIATKTGIAHKADQTKSHVIDLFPPELERHFGKIIALNGINKAEMASKISDQVRAGKDDRENLWAAELDSSFRKSLRAAGKSHLVTKAPPRDRWLGRAYMFLTGSFTISPGSGVNNVAAGLWVLGVGSDHLINRLQFGDGLLKDRRWSISPSQAQPDRYLAFKGLSRVAGLITVRK